MHGPQKLLAVGQFVIEVRVNVALQKRELLVDREATGSRDVLEFRHILQHLRVDIPRRRNVRVDRHEGDLEAASVRIGRLVLVELVQRVEDERLFARERRVRHAAVCELEHLRILEVEEAQEDEVQRRRERLRKQKHQRDVDGVEILPHTHLLQPQMILAVIVEELRPHLVPVAARPSPRQASGRQHRHLAVHALEEDAVGDPSQQRIQCSVAAGGYEEASVTAAQQPRPAIRASFRKECELEAGHLDEVDRSMRLAGSVGQLALGPHKTVRQILHLA